MKNLAALLALTAASIAAPAAAETVHQTSVAHSGGAVSVSYTPRFETSHKQTGIGPRASAGCLWTTRVAIERSVADAAGRPIAALTRVVGEGKASGNHVGHCRDIEPERMNGFSDKAELQGLVAAAAERDAHGLRTELASLEGLRVADAS